MDIFLKYVYYDLVWFPGVKRHFQQYCCDIMAVSFIGGGSRTTRRKTLTCRKSLTNFITQCCIVQFLSYLYINNINLWINNILICPAT